MSRLLTYNQMQLFYAHDFQGYNDIIIIISILFTQYFYLRVCVYVCARECMRVRARAISISFCKLHDGCFYRLINFKTDQHAVILTWNCG